jgi:hypothetical protein
MKKLEKEKANLAEEFSTEKADLVSKTEKIHLKLKEKTKLLNTQISKLDAEKHKLELENEGKIKEGKNIDKLKTENEDMRIRIKERTEKLKLETESSRKLGAQLQQFKKEIQDAQNRLRSQESSFKKEKDDAGKRMQKKSFIILMPVIAVLVLIIAVLIVLMI